MMSNSFAIALIVFFIHACYQEEMIFHWAAKWFEEILPEFLHKPVFSCPICMTPYYGAVIYLFATMSGVKGFESIHIPTMLFTLLVASGFSTLFVYLLRLVESIESYET